MDHKEMYMTSIPASLTYFLIIIVFLSTTIKPLHSISHYNNEATNNNVQQTEGAITVMTINRKKDKIWYVRKTVRGDNLYTHKSFIITITTNDLL